MSAVIHRSWLYLLHCGEMASPIFADAPSSVVLCMFHMPVLPTPHVTHTPVCDRIMLYPWEIIGQRKGYRSQFSLSTFHRMRSHGWLVVLSGKFHLGSFIYSARAGVIVRC